MTRSRGAVALLRLGKTQPQVAITLGVSKAIVAMWQSGERTPSMPNRKAMREKFGIALEAWDETPETPLSVAPASPRTEWRDSAALSRIERLQVSVDQELDALATDVEMTPLERTKVRESVARTLNSIRRMKGEEVAEVKVLKHPKWQAIWAAVFDVLRDEPEYLREILARLEADERDSA